MNSNGDEKKWRKRSIIFLAIFSVAVIFFGVWNIARLLEDPFRNLGNDDNQNSTANANQVSVSTNTNTQTARLETLRDKDTDEDGVSDYDELYIFKTSPYLTDSDSDSIDDATEINEGLDPNCPAGEDCGRTIISNTNTAAANTNATNGASSKAVSADELREVLRDAGVSEEAINELDDEALIQTYQDILQEDDLGVITNGGTNEELDSEGITYETLFNMDPDNIRELLVANGVPEETLDEIDDETLVQIYQESLLQNLDEDSTE